MNRNSRMNDFLAFAQAMANIAPPVDLNKLLLQEMIGQQARDAIAQQSKIPPADAIIPLINAFQNDPSKLAQAFPWWPKTEEGDGLPGQEELVKMLAGGPPVKARKPVLDDEGRAADALVDEEGNIIGFTQPGKDTPIEDFMPSAESIGAFPAWKYKAGNWWKNLFSFNKPQFKD